MQWPLVHRDSSWHSLTSEEKKKKTQRGLEATAKRHVLQSCGKTLASDSYWGVFQLNTCRCTPGGCCHSRSPVDSSTRSPAACSHSDPSCRFLRRTERTRRCLQTKEKNVFSVTKWQRLNDRKLLCHQSDITYFNGCLKHAICKLFLHYIFCAKTDFWFNNWTMTMLLYNIAYTI